MNEASMDGVGEEQRRWQAKRKDTAPAATDVAPAIVVGEIQTNQKGEVAKPASLEHTVEDAVGQMFVMTAMELDEVKRDEGLLKSEAQNLFSKLSAKVKEIKFTDKETEYVVSKMKEGQARLYETGSKPVMIPTAEGEAFFNVIVVVSKGELKLDLEPSNSVARGLLAN
jgi:hypothetical protein